MHGIVCFPVLYPFQRSTKILEELAIGGFNFTFGPNIETRPAIPSNAERALRSLSRRTSSARLRSIRRRCREWSWESHSPSASVWHAIVLWRPDQKFRDFRFWVHIQKSRPPGNCRPVRGSFSPKSDRRSTRNAATSESAIRRGPTMKYPDGAGTYPRARNGREQKKAAVVRGTPGLPMPAWRQPEISLL